jgi:hypothetical protein
MLENRMRRVSSCGLFCLILGLACSEEQAAFSDLDGASASEAMAARSASSRADRGTSQNPASAPALAADAGTASAPIALPPSVSLAPTGTLFCGSAPCECNNGIDDDGDGTADGFDVECTGGIDDDESSFATGIPGDNRDPKWQDCFFDGNSGAGDDRCRYPTECLTGELSLDDEACSVTQACRDNCQPRTPKGCDCFGCCAIDLPGGSSVNVLLQSSCSLEKIGDEQACPACTPSTECAAPPADPDPDPSEPNPSEPNPPTPDAGSPTGTCGSRTECNEGGGCALGEFCSLGCCLVVIN